MNEQLKQLGLTPLKAGAIGVLLLVLAAVWGPQLAARFAGPSVPQLAKASASKPASESRRNPDERAARTRRKNPSPKADPAFTSRAPTRVYTLVEASSYDPFRVPQWAPQPVTHAAGGSSSRGDADRIARIEELQETGVAMVLVSDREKVATIGDRVVRLGDEIDGFRVVEISSQGVLLLPVDGVAPTKGPRGL